MFEHPAQAGQGFHQRLQRARDEHRLTVEDIDMRVGHFAVDEQRHADRFHPREHRHDPRNVGHPMRRSGGGVRGIKLGRHEHRVRMAARHFIRVGVIGEVERHQRSEAGVIRQRGHDPRAVSRNACRIHHRR